MLGYFILVIESVNYDLVMYLKWFFYIICIIMLFLLL